MKGRRSSPTGLKPCRFRLPSASIFCYDPRRAVVVVEGATVRPIVTESTAMIILAILASLAAIAALCWLLFTLAVFALPAFVGVTVGAWAHGTGAGIVGAILVGLVAAAITLAIGNLMIAFVRPIWLKLLVAIAFVAPAALAGFHATHGIVKHLMPSDGWQMAFSIIGAIAVGITAFVRVAGMATAPAPSGPGLARA